MTEKRQPVKRWRVWAQVRHDEPMEDIIVGTRDDAEEVLWVFLSSLGVETMVEEVEEDEI